MDQNRIFDTRVDTLKMFVSMKTKIVKRKYVEMIGRKTLKKCNCMLERVFKFAV